MSSIYCNFSFENYQKGNVASEGIDHITRESAVSRFYHVRSEIPSGLLYFILHNLTLNMNCEIYFNPWKKKHDKNRVILLNSQVSLAVVSSLLSFPMCRKLQKLMYGVMCIYSSFGRLCFYLIWYPLLYIMYILSMSVVFIINFIINTLICNYITTS